MANSEYLLQVEHLKEHFPVRTGFSKTIQLKAVDDVSFAIRPGETLGLVGESGCGKPPSAVPCCSCTSPPAAVSPLTAR